MYHAHIGAALFIYAESMRFDENRFLDEPVESRYNRIEPFQMADLNDAAPLFGDPDLGFGFFQRRGDRLFNQNVHMMLKAIFADLKMNRGRHRHTDGVNHPKQRRVSGKRTRIKPFGDFIGPHRIDIDHAHKLHATHTRIFFGMEFPQIPHTDDSDT